MFAQLLPIYLTDNSNDPRYISKIPAAFFSNESNPYFSRVGFVIIKSSTKLNILKSPLLELVTSNKPWKYYILKRLALCSARQSAPENQEKTILQPMIFFTRKYTEKVSDIMYLLSCTHFASSEFRRQLFVLQFFFFANFLLLYCPRKDPYSIKETGEAHRRNL